MLAPDIHHSTREERIEYIREAWRCLANCEFCGKCSILKGRDAEEIFQDYIEGKRGYIEISIELRDKR